MSKRTKNKYSELEATESLQIFGGVGCAICTGWYTTFDGDTYWECANADTGDILYNSVTHSCEWGDGLGNYRPDIGDTWEMTPVNNTGISDNVSNSGSNSNLGFHMINVAHVFDGNFFITNMQFQDFNSRNILSNLDSKAIRFNAQSTLRSDKDPYITAPKSFPGKDVSEMIGCCNSMEGIIDMSFFIPDLLKDIYVSTL